MTNESSYTLLQKKKWRAITYDWDILSTYGNTSRLYCLTDFQVAWLLSNTAYMRWSTRWENCPCTQADMDAMKAEMEYNLMSCIDIQPYQLDYLYTQAQNQQFDAFNVGYDADGIEGVNENAPTDYYSGDDSQDRLDALCTACKIYVYSYAQEWLTKSQAILGIIAIVAVATGLVVFGGPGAVVVIAGLAGITQAMFDAMQNEDALDNVVCCMYNSLNGAVINQANFEDALSGCGFVVDSDEQLIVDAMIDDMQQFNNWLSFINMLGDAYEYAELGVSDCPCEIADWVWDSNFPLEENIWQPSDNGFGDMAEWNASTGWSSQDVQNGTSNYGRFCAIETMEFDPTQVDEMIVNFNLTKGTYTEGSIVAFVIVAVRDGGGQVRVDLTNAVLSSGDGQERTLAINQPDIVELRTYVRSSNATTAVYSGVAKINTIQVSGYGSNPFED